MGKNHSTTVNTDLKTEVNKVHTHDKSKVYFDLERQFVILYNYI